MGDFFFQLSYLRVDFIIILWINIQSSRFLRLSFNILFIFLCLLIFYFWWKWYIFLNNRLTLSFISNSLTSLFSSSCYLDLMLIPFFVVSFKFFLIIFFEKVQMIFRRENHSSCTKFIIILIEASLLALFIYFTPFSKH